MLTFSVSGPAAITTEIDAVPRCHDLESSVPVGLLIPPQPFAAQGLNRMSMWPIPLTYLAAAVQTLNVSNVSSFSQDHVLVVLYFMRTSFFAAHFPRHSVVVVYPGSCLRFSDVVRAALPTCLDFSIVTIFAYSRVPSESSYCHRLGFPVFHGGSVHDCRGNRSVFGCIVTSRCCCVSTDTSKDNKKHI